MIATAAAFATSVPPSRGRSPTPNATNPTTMKKTTTTTTKKTQKKKPGNPQKNTGNCVIEVLPEDVLLGRGSGPNDHAGNIKFRELIARRKHEYLSTNNRQAKADIAGEIVDQIVVQNGGRFLKKLNAVEAAKHLPQVLARLRLQGNHQQQQQRQQQNDDTNGKQIDVYQIQDNATILEKAKQALRQNVQRSPECSLSPSRDDLNPTSTTTQPTSTNGFFVDGCSAAAAAVNNANTIKMNNNNTNTNNTNQYFNDWNMGRIPTELNGLSSNNNNNKFPSSNKHNNGEGTRIDNDNKMFQIPSPLFSNHQQEQQQQQQQQQQFPYEQLLQQQHQQQQQQQQDTTPISLLSMSQSFEPHQLVAAGSFMAASNNTSVLEQSMTSSASQQSQQAFHHGGVPSSSSSSPSPSEMQHVYLQQQLQQMQQLQVQLEQQMQQVQQQQQNTNPNQVEHQYEHNRLEMERQKQLLQQQLELQIQQEQLQTLHALEQSCRQDGRTTTVTSNHDSSSSNNNDIRDGHDSRQQQQQQLLLQPHVTNSSDENNFKQQQHQQNPLDVLDGYATYTTTLKEMEEKHRTDGGRGGGALHRIDRGAGVRVTNLGDVTELIKQQQENIDGDGDSDGVSDGDAGHNTNNTTNNKHLSSVYPSTSNDKLVLNDMVSLNGSRASMQMSTMMESMREMSVNDDDYSKAMQESHTTMGTIDGDGGISGNLVGGGCSYTSHMSGISMMSMGMGDSSDSLFRMKRGMTMNEGSQNASWGETITAAGAGSLGGAGPSRITAYAANDLMMHHRRPSMSRRGSGNHGGSTMRRGSGGHGKEPSSNMAAAMARRGSLRRGSGGSGAEPSTTMAMTRRGSLRRGSGGNGVEPSPMASVRRGSLRRGSGGHGGDPSLIARRGSGTHCSTITEKAGDSNNNNSSSTTTNNNNNNDIYSSTVTQQASNVTTTTTNKSLANTEAAAVALLGMAGTATEINNNNNSHLQQQNQPMPSQYRMSFGPNDLMNESNLASFNVTNSQGFGSYMDQAEGTNNSRGATSSSAAADGNSNMSFNTFNVLDGTYMGGSASEGNDSFIGAHGFSSFGISSGRTLAPVLTSNRLPPTSEDNE